MDYPLGGVVHDVDVSDDGQYVAAPYPGPNASIDPTGAPNLVLLDRAGAVVWKRTVFGESPTATIYGQQVRVGSSGPTAVKFSHDARSLAYGTGSGQLVVIDRATQAVRWRDFLRDQVRAISWSGGDGRIYASSGDNDVYALDAATGTVLWRTDVGGWSIAWAASKHYLLANAKQGYAITAVRLPDGTVAWRYPSVETSYGLAISPDESAFASVNATNTAPGTVLFDRRGRLLWAVPEQGNAVAFSGNSRYLLTEANTGNPRGAPDRLDLYSAKTGELVWSRPLSDRSTVWNGGSSAVLYLSNDASTILAGNPDGGFVYFFKGRVTPRK